MLNFRIVLSGGQHKALVKTLAAAKKRGDVAMVERLLAVKAIAGKSHTRVRRIFVRIQGVSAGA